MRIPAFLVAVMLFGAPLSQAQTATIVGPDGKPRQIAVPQGMPPGAKPPGQPPKPGEKPDEKDAGKNGGADKKGEPPEPKIIRRGDQKPGDANPEELKATVGEDGRVAFQFRNQPWVDLVQWLAQIADQPLDWQELPADRVNLRSPGRYTVEQTKDLFNRHLLARGYTLLDMPGGITVAKTQGINPAMVPRVTESQLEGLSPHTFVRISLETGWLSSEKMAAELKPMVSSNGQLTALSTTNRLEAMDAAINLQQIAKLLSQERNDSSREALAPEFKLRHIPAESAKKMLEEFLGVQKKQAAPMSPQQMQMMQQMARQNGGRPPTAQKEPDISIVANTRQNSVFIRAPIDRIAVATEFLTRIDVPGKSITSLSDVESRVEVFHLYTINPEKLIEIIAEMNVLEPGTRIRSDETNRAIIVSGSAADRYIIERLIQRLDGSGRTFEVLQLRRLEATEVAESISFLMGKDKDDDDNNNSRRYFYYGFGGNDDKDKNKDEFRVAANARYRQVLLWANESEMEQVRNLLIKLGELPPPGGSRSMVRRIDASSAPETYEYLLRLQQQWSQISNTPLSLPNSDQFVDPILGTENTEEEKETESPEDGDPSAPTSSDDLEARRRRFERQTVSRVFVTTEEASEAGSEVEKGQQDEAPAGATEGVDPQSPDIRSQIQSSKDFDRLFRKTIPQPTEPSAASDAAADPSIRIELDEDGNLVIVGSDPKALDQLENLMLQFAPPKRPYHVFKIKHQSAGYVQLNLEEYFEKEDEEEDSGSSFFRYIYGIGNDDDKGPAGLGKENKLRFVYDPDTNTIVVSGATSSQLKTISELIKLWDVAEPVNKRRMRYTKLVKVEYGSAASIAETVKEAYRDLLSSNDKTFNKGGNAGGGNQPGAAGPSKSSGRDRQSGSGLIDSENGRDGGDVDFSFKGKLSMGVDEVGNTLLVSAEGEPLLELVIQMINQLDMAAKPAGDMQIISVSGKTSNDAIEKVLEAFSGRARQGAQANAPNQPSPPNPNPQFNPGQPAFNPNFNRRRGPR
ncbi:secretin N-terminal domain-containing protein [Roseiconus lacunae]|uniref:secretin N-terminal domain-containing protein n=1 Tax=Roseiconus lacunae TaxID=2605694 RepID=UPI001F23CC5F|nr:secretin N-terminal domain-containing protein [Roseiconus lacunae]